MAGRRTSFRRNHVHHLSAGQSGDGAVRQLIRLPLLPAVLTLLLGLGGGCRAAPDYLLSPPVVYSQGGVDPFRGLDPLRQSTRFDVLYVTNRAPDGPIQNRRYGTRVGRRLRAGLAQVQIGRDNFTWNDLYRASMGHEDPGRVPLRLGRVAEWVALGRGDHDAEQAFADIINAKLRQAGSGEILVYVHGFNNPFSTPVCRVAQLYHYFGHGQVCLAYSWPSQNSMWRYLSDLRRARNSVPQFVELLQFLAQRTDVERINILSYSSGARVVSGGLVALYDANGSKSPEELRAQTKIGRVLFVASDADLQTFAERELQRFYEMPLSIGIIVSRFDTALRFAAFLSGAAPLGTARVPTGLTPAELEHLAEVTKIDVIDLGYSPESDIDSFRGHFYWYTNPWVLTDILASFRFHLPPGQRGLVHHPSRPVWHFPDDYPQRISEIIRELVQPRAPARGPADESHPQPAGKAP